MTNPFPHEMLWGDVYFSPILVVIVFAFIFAGLTALILNKLKLA
jgi:hypothetical protein